jgi:hypothetical protein
VLPDEVHTAGRERRDAVSHAVSGTSDTRCRCQARGTLLVVIVSDILQRSEPGAVEATVVGSGDRTV